jgi:hypothetical protein
VPRRSRYAGSSGRFEHLDRLTDRLATPRFVPTGTLALTALTRVLFLYFIQSKADQRRYALRPRRRSCCHQRRYRSFLRA